jgi:hypothetical protein
MRLSKVLTATCVGVLFIAPAAVGQSSGDNSALVSKARMPADLYRAILAAPDDTPTSGKAVDIPQSISQRPEDFADAGAPYAITDVVMKGEKTQRVVWIARIGDIYVIAFERGGIVENAVVEALQIDVDGRAHQFWSADAETEYKERIEPRAQNRYRTFASFKAALGADQIVVPAPVLVTCGGLLPTRAMGALLPRNGAPPPFLPVASVPDSIMPILRSNAFKDWPAGTDLSAVSPPEIRWVVKWDNAYVVQYDTPNKQPLVTIAKDPPEDASQGYWTGRVRPFENFDTMMNEVRQGMTPAVRDAVRRGTCVDH